MDIKLLTSLANKTPELFRYLLSLLVDVDHTDTAIHYGNSVPLSVMLEPAVRLKRLRNHVAILQENKSSRNIVRNMVFQDCNSRNNISSTRIAELSALVGSGKTFSSMAHALVVCGELKLRRVIYVAPFTHIIQQTVSALSVICGENEDHPILEHHFRVETRNKNHRHLVTTWDAPIIATTAVRFFETLAGAKTARLKRYHNLCGSVIILDEFHTMLPEHLWDLAIKWLNYLVKHMGCYIIFCSGTSVPIWDTILTTEKMDVIPILSNETCRLMQEQENRRIVYKKRDSYFSTQGLIDWVMGFDGPRLLIVNTVKTAAIIAHYIAEQYGEDKVAHLSSALTPTDQDKTKRNIKKRLKNGDKDWVLVSTSIAEVGLDLSFYVGFREGVGLLNILQAGGRINREGMGIENEFWIFNIDHENEETTKHPSMERYDKLTQLLWDDLDLSDIRNACNEYFNAMCMYDNNFYTNTIAELRELECNKDFKEVQKRFDIIDNNSVMVVVDEQTKVWLKAEVKIPFSKVQKQSVQIRAEKVREWLDKGYIEEIVEDNIYGLCLDYSEFLGYYKGIMDCEKGCLIV